MVPNVHKKLILGNHMDTEKGMARPSTNEQGCTKSGILVTGLPAKHRFWQPISGWLAEISTSQLMVEIEGVQMLAYKCRRKSNP